MKYTVDTETKTIEIHGDFEAKDIILLDKTYPGFKFRSVETTITVPVTNREEQFLFGAPYTPILAPHPMPGWDVLCGSPSTSLTTTCEADHQQAMAMTPPHLRNTLAQA